MPHALAHAGGTLLIAGVVWGWWFARTAHARRMASWTTLAGAVLLGVALWSMGEFPTPGP